MNRKKLTLSIIIGVAISVLFLFLAFRQAEMSEMIQIITHTNIPYLLLLIPFPFILIYLRALRWQVILRSIRRVSIPSLFSSTIIGFMVNHTLPLRIGEFARAYSLARKEQLSTVECFGTIITERVYDLLALFLMLIPLLFVPEVSQQFGEVGTYLVLALLLFYLFFLYLSRYGSRFLEYRIVSALIPRKIFPLVASLVRGLQSLQSWRDLLIVIAISIISWMGAGFLYYVGLAAFHITHLPVWSGFVILIFIAFGVALPSAPGYIGTYHYFAILALELFGIDRDTAQVYSIVTHGLQTIFFIGVGLICLFYEGMKISEAIARSREFSPITPEEKLLS